MTAQERAENVLSVLTHSGIIVNAMERSALSWITDAIAAAERDAYNAAIADIVKFLDDWEGYCDPSLQDAIEKMKK